MPKLQLDDINDWMKLNNKRARSNKIQILYLKWVDMMDFCSHVKKKWSKLHDRTKSYRYKTRFTKGSIFSLKLLWVLTPGDSNPFSSSILLFMYPWLYCSCFFTTGSPIDKEIPVIPLSGMLQYTWMDRRKEGNDDFTKPPVIFVYLNVLAHSWNV